jgi:hypothetical protein
MHRAILAVDQPVVITERGTPCSLVFFAVAESDAGPGYPPSQRFGGASPEAGFEDRVKNDGLAVARPSRMGH